LIEGKRNILNEERLCQSMGGVDVPLLTITGFDGKIPITKRKLVIVSARIHPGESNSSWMMHGLLEYLFSTD